MSGGYLRELEAMAAAARAKGRASAPVLEGVARAWAEDCEGASAEEQREAFDYALDVARQLDAEIDR